MKTFLISLFFILSWNIQANDSFQIKNAELLKVKQEGLMWCWAATLEAMGKWQGKKINQYSIVKKQFKLNNEELIRQKQNPIGGIDPRFYEKHYLKAYKEIEKSAIEKNLLKNKPVIYLANNHVSIIVGFNENEYITMDTQLGDFITVAKNQLHFRNNFDINPATFFIQRK